MRRISHLTKEAFCHVRIMTVAAQERLELWETQNGQDTVKELYEIHESLIDSLSGSLMKCVGIELEEIKREFDLKAEDVTEPFSAFPYLQGTEVSLEESAIEYCTEIVSDVMEVTSIPAITIADEFEEWLSELYEWHSKQG